jgi:hypothetical protein
MYWKWVARIHTSPVMAGLDPAILFRTLATVGRTETAIWDDLYETLEPQKDDGRVKPGHDG